MDMKEFFASFKPGFDAVPPQEKMRSALAAMTGILLVGLSVHFVPESYPLTLLASSGASAALLYAVPHSPMAQPWPLVGGHILSALAGWVCSLLVPDPLVGSAIAAGVSILVMQLLHCLHPPGVATALIIVLNADRFHQYGWQWVAAIVTANALFSLLMALLINNLIPGRRYPAHQKPAEHPAPVEGASVALGRENIEWALTQMDSVIDVSEEDLLEIYRMASGHARENNSRAAREE